MPELPEVERARRLLADHALDRTIVDVDDRDEFVTRPHRPGELRSALTGRTLTAAHRRGKSMWLTTSPNGTDTDGPDLGIHLGMGGVLVVRDADGSVFLDGDPNPTARPTVDDGPYGAASRAAGPHKPEWDRFVLRFADGGTLALFDKRRLGRVRLDPAVDGLGPDALGLPRARFRDRMGRSTAPVKARLLDQSVLAGVGNLLADEALWRAKIHPATPVSELDDPAMDRLHRSLKGALDDAIAQGGVHTGRVIPARVKGGRCPRCRAAMEHGTVGGRSTWWCTREQVR
ncbi:Fpg/Nei family DNA glycosylase [Nakamurella leprariae]|uniref:Formamidopyrimidine-DNA glycosylase n=1 Tax=Nakamurella leprariae TaxID=2803911 RepID=A0A938Y9T2_9ACTN|nr:DNA-formamidopyrimidine glycosylase family protein [Nakamurella leprariae]MBM9465814.1 formamidopyrimidine-DNA glycosylase [Nakamurella leprariae]